MIRPLIALAASLVLLAGCEGFKEAMTAHVDVVASAGSQELSVERLANLLGSSQVPVTKENARTLADVWVDYQLLAEAAANGDSLSDPKVIDEALWPIIAQQRASKWHEQISQRWTADTVVTEADYAQGDILAAQHILFATGDSGVNVDSVRRAAEAVRAQVTPGNFADLARRYSGDPGSKDRGGLYPAFPRGAMVREFEQAVANLRPGEIAPGLVQTNFGLHIIRRPTFAEVKDQYTSEAARASVQRAESTYMAKVLESGEVRFRDDAAATIRKTISDPDDARDDRAVIASVKGGDFTAARLARWLGAYPPQQQMMLRAQMGQVPDSLLVNFVKNQFIQNELVLRQADSAKVQLTPQEMNDLRNRFAGVVQQLWSALGLTPAQLGDSAATPEQRERLAAAKVDQYVEALLNNRAQFIDVPPPV
jgi:hypothetical protein